MESNLGLTYMKAKYYFYFANIGSVMFFLQKWSGASHEKKNVEIQFLAPVVQRVIWVTISATIQGISVFNLTTTTSAG